MAVYLVSAPGPKPGDDDYPGSSTVRVVNAVSEVRALQEAVRYSGTRARLRLLMAVAVDIDDVVSELRAAGYRVDAP